MDTRKISVQVLVTVPLAIGFFLMSTFAGSVVPSSWEGPLFWAGGIMAIWASVAGWALSFKGHFFSSLGEAIKNIRLQWPFYQADKPYTREPLSKLIPISKIMVEVKDFKKTGTLRFTIIGYNATPYPLDFRLKKGQIIHTRKGKEETKLPTPAIEIPWKNKDGGTTVFPYTKFAIHLVQTFSGKLKGEIIKVLEGEGHAAFSFEDIEIVADAISPKRDSIPLTFERGNGREIHVSRKDGVLWVSIVISATMAVTVTAKAKVN